MSDEITNIDVDAEEFESANPKLREAYKALRANNAKLQEELGKTAKLQRANDLTNALKAKGVDEKLARFYPNDGDTSPDKVNEWLQENADVFHLDLAAVTPEQQALQDQIAQQQKLTGLTGANSLPAGFDQTAPPTPGSFEEALNTLHNPTLSLDALGQMGQLDPATIAELKRLYG